jgi:hypothetical protein
MLKKIKTELNKRELIRQSVDLDADTTKKLKLMCKKLNYTHVRFIRDLINIYYNDYFTTESNKNV